MLSRPRAFVFSIYLAWCSTLNDECLTVSSKPVDPIPGTDFRPTLLALKEAHASVVVLLSEGYDGMFVRAVFEQVRFPSLIFQYLCRIACENSYIFVSCSPCACPIGWAEITAPRLFASKARLVRYYSRSMPRYWRYPPAKNKSIVILLGQSHDGGQH